MRDEILLILLPNAWWFCLIDFILIIGIVFIVATIMSTIFTTIDKIKTENFSSHGTLSGVRKKKQKQKSFRANSFRNNPQPLSKRLCAKTSLKCAGKQATQWEKKHTIDSEIACLRICYTVENFWYLFCTLAFGFYFCCANSTAHIGYVIRMLVCKHMFHYTNRQTEHWIGWLKLNKKVLFRSFLI